MVAALLTCFYAVCPLSTEPSHKNFLEATCNLCLQGDAMKLPFEDRSFDAATMGYGLRNVADKPRALAELCRVLRPGCRVAILVCTCPPYVFLAVGCPTKCASTQSLCLTKFFALPGL